MKYFHLVDIMRKILRREMGSCIIHNYKHEGQRLKKFMSARKTCALMLPAFECFNVLTKHFHKVLTGGRVAIQAHLE